jgi:hypothetical protein
MSLARDSLDKFKTALDDGNTAPLAEMLAENFIFEDSVGDQDGKAAVLAWAGAGGFTVGDWVVFHEDNNVICGTHSRTQDGGPNYIVMYFARFEAKKCVYWKVHRGCAI